MTPLEKTWTDSPGLLGSLSTVDHKRISMRYIVTSLVFFALAGLLALVMRTTSFFPCTAAR